MGYGDEIMATGAARRMQLADSRPVAVRGKDGGARWHAVFDNNPRLSRAGAGDVQWLEDWSGHRPYIESYNSQRFIWRTSANGWHGPERGELYFSPAELGNAALVVHERAVVIEPNVKADAPANKDWGGRNWQAVVAALPGVPWLQMGPPSTRWLRGVKRVLPADFRAAAAILAHAVAYVGHEGGLHHAAAALGKPAVVVFGGFISPAQTGYEAHRNIFTGGQPCGWRRPCTHCVEALAKITPRRVVLETEGMLWKK